MILIVVAAGCRLRKVLSLELPVIKFPITSPDAEKLCQDSCFFNGVILLLHLSWLGQAIDFTIFFTKSLDAGVCDSFNAPVGQPSDGQGCARSASQVIPLALRRCTE